MKNKKGFTLTELLVVIVILVAVAGTTIFGMEEISKKSDEKSLREIEKQIKLATDVYLSNNDVYLKSLLNGEIEEKCTRLYVLENEGLLDINLTNPLTTEKIPGNLCVISKVNPDGVIEHTFDFDY